MVANKGNILYTVIILVKFEKYFQEEFQEYMLNEHIPDVINTGCFISYDMFKMTDGNGYVVNYLAKNKENMEKYKSEFKDEMTGKFKTKYVHILHMFEFFRYESEWIPFFPGYGESIGGM